MDKLLKTPESLQKPGYFEIMATQRLFLGVPVSASDCEAIHKWRAKQTISKGIKWVKDGQLHLSVYFFGHVESEVIFNLIQLIMLGLKDYSVFELSLQGAVLAPRAKDPRMIWLRYDKHHQFRDLVNQIGKLYNQISPNQQFRKSPVPHVTLARLKRNAFWQELDLDILGVEPEFPIKQMILWESHLHPTGPVYQEIQRFDLD